jgi:hypothetical protein
MRGKKEVSDILREFGERIETIGLNTFQLRVFSLLRRCRTADLGGHIDACTECGIVRVSYNSCRNRHCPKCQGNKREEWIQARNSELLPVPYFHVVFTLPEELNALCMFHPKESYSILFKSAWETLRLFASRKYLKTGMISVLHTWGQNLTLHPHLHCIVPGGGIDKNGKWKNIRVDGKFLFPVKALGKVFRAKYVSMLRERSLLSQESIISYENNRVSFSYKDYRHGGCKKIMDLDDKEFIRRFALHILPSGFVRIRHYGILSSTSKKTTIPSIREQLAPMDIGFIDLRKVKPFDRTICPCCGNPSMVTIETIFVRGPPNTSANKYPDLTSI